MLFLLKNQKSLHYGHKCDVCFSEPMFIRVVILLRSFNPPNVADLKIDHVGIFLRTVQLYLQLSGHKFVAISFYKDLRLHIK